MLENLVWPKDVPKEFYWKAMESLAKQGLHDLRTTRAFHEGMDRLRSEYMSKLREIIGNGNLRLYDRLHAARLEKIRAGMRNLPGPSGGERDIDALRSRLVRDSGKSIERSGVDLSAVDALRALYGRKAALLAGRTVGKGTTGRSIPRPKNTDYDPPYFLDARWYDHYESESSLPEPSLSLYFNDRTGDMGSRTRIYVSGADEWDLVSATCRTGFLMIYHNERTGQPVLNLDLEAVSLYCQGSISNECGHSDASVRQRARLYGQVYLDGGAPRRTYCPTDLINVRRSGRSDSWSSTLMAAGADLSRTFVLATPVPADTYILVGVGIETYNEFLSNDCGVDSTIEARFLARTVGITTTT